jgi:5-methylcytosine-specific restriction endonuclease McrA
MHYKLHRVAPNSQGWTRPSPGRLGAPGVGEYVQENGFGHEDWNFNFSLARDGMMLGYTVARPAKKFLGEEFRLVLATFSSNAGWQAVGYYDGGVYKEDPEPLTAPALEQMASDVFRLAKSGSLSNRYNRMTKSQVHAAITQELSYHSWEIPIERVVVFEAPIPIAPNIFAPGRQRMVTSYNLTESQFDAIIEEAPAIFYTRAPPETFEEGSRRVRLHNAIERNRRLIDAFKRSLTSFACTVCGFDFEAEYGDIGNKFIECHHTRPVSEMNPDGDSTSLHELIAVCPNCHRMLHKKKPMVTAEALRKMRRATTKQRR